MARTVPMTLAAVLAVVPSLALSVLAQTPGVLPSCPPAMILVREGDALRIDSELPGVPLWLVIGDETAHIPIAGVVLEVEPDLVVGLGGLGADGTTTVPLQSELRQLVGEKLRFQALALTAASRLVISNPVQTQMPVDPPQLLVHDLIPDSTPDVELFRVACAPVSWVASITATVPTTGYRLELVETRSSGNLFQATAALARPAPGHLVGPAFTPLSLVFDITGTQPIATVEITLVTRPTDSGR